MNEEERRDLLRGRERRQHQEYAQAERALCSSIRWLEEALAGQRGYPALTVAYFDREVRPTLGPRMAALEETLRAWLVTREELGEG